MKKNLYFCFYIFLIVSGYSQQQEPEFDIIPKSPTVSSLGKYIDFPISLYTGQAEVSVPIYNLVVKDIQVPISLQHHTGGVRVEEIASSVGLNWSLVANGTVIRRINGIADNASNFFYEEPSYILNSSRFTSHVGSAHGSIDTEHDYYYYSAGNHNGKYAIDFLNGSTPVQFPVQDVKIEHNGINAPKITTPDGLIYFYNKTEVNNSSTSCNSTGSSNNNSLLSPTTWFLTRIESQTSDAYVDFIYETKYLEYDQNGPQTKYKNIVSSRNDNDCIVKNKINTQRLLAIESSDGQRVDFVKGALRADLENDYLLSEIVVTNTQSSFLKRFVLTHEYLGGPNPSDPSYDPINIEDYQRERMRPILTKVQEFGKNNTAIAPYTFEYNFTGQGLPSRRSFNQDHWGYYNGAGNNTLVPSIIYQGYVLPGADRKPDYTSAIQGTLSKITFPTGGSRSFVYELNECKNCSFLDYASVSNVQYETHTMRSNDFFANQNQSIIEKNFTVNGQEPGEIILNMSTETSFCSSWPCEIELKLYSLNPDNSINQLVFDSYQYRTEPDINILDIVVNHTFSGKYKLQMKVNDSQWASNQDEYYLQVKWAIPLSTNGLEYNTAGGLRTKQIKMYDPVLNQTIQKDYTYEDGYLSGWLSYARMSEFIFGFTACPTFPPNIACVPQPMFGLGMARTSNPILSTSNTKGGIVGYNKVTVSELGNGYIENYYYSPFHHRDINWIEESYNNSTISDLPQDRTFKGDLLIDTQDWYFPFSLSDEKDWKRGLIKRQLTYKEGGFLQKKIETNYHFYDDISLSSYDPSKIKAINGSRTGAELAGGRLGKISVNFYTLQSSWYDIDEVIETNYFETGQELTTTTKYEYSPNQRTVKTKTIIKSNSGITKQETLYPTDYSNSYLGSNILRDRNMILIPLVQKSFSDGSLLNEKRSNYLLNGTLADLDFIENLPHGIDSGIKTNILRDAEGNISQVSQTNAPPVSYVWGYNKTYPVAKLENVEYSDVENNSTLIGYLNQLDNYTTIDNSNILALKLLNENIRNSSTLSNAMVTTYTYDPLIGVTSITDPRGYTTYYEYDDLNRLKHVKDADGNILSENEYNYKQ